MTPLEGSFDTYKTEASYQSGSNSSYTNNDRDRYNRFQGERSGGSYRGQYSRGGRRDYDSHRRDNFYRNRRDPGYYRDRGNFKILSQNLYQFVMRSKTLFLFSHRFCKLITVLSTSQLSQIRKLSLKKKYFILLWHALSELITQHTFCLLQLLQQIFLSAGDRSRRWERGNTGPYHNRGDHDYRAEYRNFSPTSPSKWRHPPVYPNYTPHPFPNINTPPPTFIPTRPPPSLPDPRQASTSARQPSDPRLHATGDGASISYMKPPPAPPDLQKANSSRFMGNEQSR